MSLTRQRTIQYIGILFALFLIAVGYWYWQARAGVKQGAPLGGPAPSNLVGYWSFDGDDISGTTAYDRSGSGNNGTLTNGPTKTNGKLGQAMSFDGSNDYVVKATPAGLPTGSSSRTFVVWFKNATLPSSGSGYEVVGHGGNTTNGDRFGLWQEYNLSCAGKYAIGVEIRNAGLLYQWNPDTNWHHLAIAYSSGNINTASVFLDGILLNSPCTSSATAPNTTNQELAIGRIPTNVSYFPGSIDEVRIYNTALTAAQVYDLYKLGGETVGASTPTRDSLNEGLAGYWKLDDGSGTTATDSSTNANNGTLTNGPTWGTGQIGGGVTFDGTDDVITAGNNLDIGTGDVTMSSWINAANANQCNMIMGKRVDSGGYAQYTMWAGHLDSSGVCVSSKKIACFFYDGTFVDNIHAQNYRTTDDILDGNWHHVACRRTSGQGIAIFVDGMSRALTAMDDNTTSVNTTNAGPFLMGARNVTGAAPFAGTIDEARVYNRALSADEISRLYKTTTPSNPDTRLKGYWSFDGDAIAGTSARDLSGAGNNGTLTNGPTTDPGIRGQAMSFDGVDDYIRTGNTTAFDSLFSSGITVCSWVKYTNFLAYNRTITINDNTNLDYDVWLQSNITTGLIQFGAGGAGRYKTSNTSLQAGSWYYLCGETDYTSGGTKIFINGVDDGGTVNVTPLYISDKGSLDIGVFESIGKNYGLGVYDEVRIYNTALSASEIWNLYQEGGVKVNKAQNNNGDSLNDGLAGYWKMDDGSGATATDSSGNANSGTLTNGPTWGTGQIGGDVVFDGTNDYISTASFVNSFSNTTYSYWAYFPNVAQSPYARTITTGPFNTGPSVGISHELNPAGQGNNKLKICHWGICNGSMTITVNLDQWNLITHTVDSSNNAIVYLNGVQVAQSNSATHATGSAVFTMGMGDGYPFKGSLDEVRIYNRALSAEEVTRLYKTTSPTNPETGLVGYWSFNGKDMAVTTAYDRSGKGNNGTLTNGPTTDPGKIGQALNFVDTSSQYVEVADNASLNFGANSFSITSWFKMTTGAPSYYSIIDKAMTNFGPMYYILITNTGAIDVRVLGTSGNGIADTQRGSGYNDNTWHHLVWLVNRSSNISQIYVDGAKVGADIDISSVTGGVDPSSVLRIGNTVPGVSGPYPFLGQIDEVRIYNRALSSTEISTLYNFGR